MRGQEAKKTFSSPTLSRRGRGAEATWLVRKRVGQPPLAGAWELWYGPRLSCDGGPYQPREVFINQ